MKNSLIALAFGTLSLGISEFVMMGILPDVAADMHVGIARAGHLISTYALGVCMGAPGLVLARKYRLKNILLVLGAIMMLGNLVTAFSPISAGCWAPVLCRDCLTGPISASVPS